ncbi:MAG: hypothetical protein V2A54_16700 [Bacteroidota bacterium]
MKKKFYLIILLVLLAIAAYVFFTNRSGTINSNEKDFAVTDTASVVKIFLADKSNHQSLLERTDNGWSLNGKFKARDDLIKVLLSTIHDVTVIAPVSNNAYNNVIRDIAATGTKVEIYYRSWWIDIFGIKLFRITKKKVYYVGSPTQDHLGTEMLIENSNMAFVNYVPGHRGFLSQQYTPLETDWRDRTICSYYVPEIASLSVKQSEFPNESYQIESVSEKQFKLQSLDGRSVPNYDTTAVLGALSSFYRLCFEEFVQDFPKKKLDSILQSKPCFDISLKDKKGKITRIVTYRRNNPLGNIDMEGNPWPYDPDRLFAQINGGKDFVIIQYFVFDKIFKKLSDFIPPPPDKVRVVY